ncbi:uncharacterized protein METZ01_LOCUS148735, partial [marine metagenome]
IYNPTAFLQTYPKFVLYGGQCQNHKTYIQGYKKSGYTGNGQNSTRILSIIGVI